MTVGLYLPQRPFDQKILPFYSNRDLGMVGSEGRKKQKQLYGCCFLEIGIYFPNKSRRPDHHTCPQITYIGYYLSAVITGTQTQYTSKNFN